MAEQVEDQAADGVPLGVGELRAELVAHLVDRRSSRDAQCAVCQVFDDGRLDVVLVGDLADDLLEQVLERDQPGRAAVLVDDDGHVELLGLHLAQELGDALLLRYEDGRAHGIAHGLSALAVAHAPHEVLHEDETGDVVGGALVGRKA